MELIRSTAGLEAEVGNQIHICRLIQNGNGQFAAFVNHFVGVIIFVQANGNLHRAAGNLYNCIGSAAGQCPFVFCTDYIQSVSQFK